MPEANGWYGLLSYAQVHVDDVRLNTGQLTFAQASATERAAAPAYAESTNAQKRSAQLGMGQVYVYKYCGLVLIHDMSFLSASTPVS